MGKHQDQEELVEADVACVLADIGSSASSADGCEYCIDCGAKAETKTRMKTEKMSCLFDSGTSEQVDLEPVGRSRSDWLDPWWTEGQTDVGKAQLERSSL